MPQLPRGKAKGPVHPPGKHSLPTRRGGSRWRWPPSLGTVRTQTSLSRELTPLDCGYAAAPGGTGPDERRCCWSWRQMVAPTCAPGCALARGARAWPRQHPADLGPRRRPMKPSAEGVTGPGALTCSGQCHNNLVAVSQLSRHLTLAASGEVWGGCWDPPQALSEAVAPRLT